MGPISFLHLSDLHYDKQKHKDIEVVIKALKADLRRIKEEENIQPSFVVFSGDLVQAGKTSDDFAAAYEVLIEPLAETVGLDTDLFFLTPGNHDIDRDKVNDALDMGLKVKCTNLYKVNEIIDSFKSRPYYLDRLGAFNQFTSCHTPRGQASESNFFRSFRFNVADVEVGIGCLNSCWLATGEPGDADDGNLFLGERQISDAAEYLKDCDLKIAVMHHPFDWLSRVERRKMERRLLREFDLLLFGHHHDPIPETMAYASEGAIVSHGGCLYQHLDYFNGYTVISCDLKENSATLLLRTYSDDRGGFDKATHILDDGKQVYPLKVRKTRKATSEQSLDEMQRSQGLTDLVDFKTELNPDGRLEVFARNKYGALWHIWQDPTCPGGWSNWACLMGKEIETLDVKLNMNRLLEVFGLGKDKKIWHIWQDNRIPTGWSEWHSLEGEIDHFRVAQNSDGHLEVFAKWLDSSLRHRWQSSAGWSDWDNLEGSIESFEVSRNADGRLEVFSQWTDGSRQHIWQVRDAGWSSWHSLG